MNREISIYSHRELAIPDLVPTVIAEAGDRASQRFLEFFMANIRNPNTRQAYYHAVRLFLDWCEMHHISLKQVEPMIVAVYVEEMNRFRAKPTVQQHLAAIRMLCDYLVIGQVLPFNPAASVRAPKFVIRKGKTPVLTAGEARRLLNSIDSSHVVGLRDRALIAVMVYSFARVSAVIGMQVEDYYRNGKRWWLRLHEKGGKYHELPVHHQGEAYLDSYLEAAGIADQRVSPLFRSTRGQSRRLTLQRMSRRDVLRMIKRRSRAIGLSHRICCHTFRATGITTFLQNGGSIETAQRIAAHESPRTTKLYDRTGDEITLDEIERIRI